MKQRMRNIFLILIVLILLYGAWLLGYKVRKNPDNVPSKERMISYCKEKNEQFALEYIEGFSRDVLTMIWQEPDGHLFGFYGDIWSTEGGELIVYYDQNSKVQNLRCRLPEADSIVFQNTYQGTITDILTENKNTKTTDNVLEVKTERGEVLYFTLVEESKPSGSLSVGSTVSIVCEEYSYTGYMPIISINVT